MSLVLEITKDDGSVVTTPVTGQKIQIDAQAGDKFRVIDPLSGNAPAELQAVRLGDTLVIDGLPEMAPIEIADFYKHGEADEASVLIMADAQAITPTAAPMMMAQAPAATPAVTATDASADKGAAAAADNPALSSGKIALGVLGIVGVAAAAGSGGSDNPAPVPAPGPGPAPVPAPGPSPAPVPAAPTGVDLEGPDNDINAAEVAGGVTVTGNAEAGSTVTVSLLNGGGTAVATATATADGTGAFTATIAAGDVPATDGAYTLRAVAANASGTGAASDTAITVSANTVTLNGTGAAETLVGGAANAINGDAGADIILGDAGGGVRNGDFDFWNSSYGANAFAAGSTLGWATVFGATAPVGASANVGFNNNPFGPTDGSVELTANALGKGAQAWETVFDGNSGGGGLTQTVNTVAGQAYTLTIGADDLSIAGNAGANGTSLNVVWDGASVAFRDTATGAWTGSATVTEASAGGVTTWTIALPAALTGSTALTLEAFEDYSPGGFTPGLGDGSGIEIVGVALTGAVAANGDTINGGADNDLIWGQGGNDTLTGDTGSDVFVFSMGQDNGTNTITDFTVGADRIQLINVIDADATGSLAVGDGVAIGTTTTSDVNLTSADLVAASQSIAVTLVAGAGADGVLTLTFSGTNGSAGSVAITVDDFATVSTYVTPGDAAASLTALQANNIIGWTGDGFNNGLAI